MLDNAVKPKRRRRLQEGLLLGLITHITEERLIQSRRVDWMNRVLLPVS